MSNAELIKRARAFDGASDSAECMVEELADALEAAEAARDAALAEAWDEGSVRQWSYYLSAYAPNPYRTPDTSGGEG